jgi:glutamine synthetase
MEPRNADELSAARRFVVARGLEHNKVGVFDVDGVLSGKYLSRDKFLGVLEQGFGVCDVVPGEHSNDPLYGNKGQQKRQRPATLEEAATGLAASAPARALFGEAFVEHHAATRQSAEREFRTAIAEREMARCREII